MTNLSQGLYYALLTEALQEELRRLDPNFISRGTLHHADVADRIAMHVARVVERAISGISDSERVAGGVELARTLTTSAISPLYSRPVHQPSPTSGRRNHRRFLTHWVSMCPPANIQRRRAHETELPSPAAQYSFTASQKRMKLKMICGYAKTNPRVNNIPIGKHQRLSESER